MITTTLNRIRAHSPCQVGWEKLLNGLGKKKADDERLPFSRIVEINGINDALWCCRVEPQYEREWRLFAVACVRRIQHLMKDPRSIDALDVAERFANGEATDEELVAAGDAAGAAWAASAAAGDAARGAWVAAGAAAGAAGAARAAEREWQTQEFIRVVNAEAQKGAE